MNWRAYFSSVILKRGQDYFDKGFVNQFSMQKNKAVAVVSGTQDYHVRIKFRNNQPVDWQCDCPYADDHDECKHIVAVLLAWEAENRSERGDNSKENEVLKNIQENLPEFAKIIKSNVRQILRFAGDRYHYIDYYHISAVTKEFLYIFNESIVPIMNFGNPLVAFELTLDILVQYSKYDVDDSDGDTAILCEQCRELFAKQIEQATFEQEEKMFKLIEKSFKINKKNEYIEEFLEDILLSCFNYQELLKKCLAIINDKIQQIKDEKKETYYRSFFIGDYAVKLIHILQKLSCSDDEIQKTIDTYWECQNVRSFVIEQAVFEKQYAKAVQILQESKILDKERSNIVEKRIQTLIALYQETNQIENLKEELQSYIFGGYVVKFSYIEMLKNLLDVDEWKLTVEKIIGTPRYYRLLPELYKAENRMRDLLEWVLQANSLHELDNWEKDLKKFYPTQLCYAYVDLLDKDMKMASDRQRYAYIIKFLKKIKTYPDGENISHKLAEKWKNAYPLRKAMLDELAKLGY